MGTLKVGTIRGEGDVTIRTTVHGPVAGYATSGGRPIAITRDRASRGRDVLFQLAFRDLTLNKVTSPRTFFRAMAKSPFTFNAAYADDRDIAMYSAGRLPVRHPDVDPRLLTDGSGPYDWRGFLPEREHPQQVARPDGVLVNWNNRPAPGWPAADNNWTWGSLHRVELLNAGIEARPTHDLASVVGVMNKAATQDLRAVGLVPVIRRVLAAAPAPTARAQAALDQLISWSDAGGSRVDRDLDGVMDAGAGPAVMDAAYRRMADAALAPVLGPELEQLNALVGADNTPRTGFTGGRVWILDKDLRTLLGDRVPQPYRFRFCGGGDLAACAASLWAALDDAAAELEAAQGPDVSAWRADATQERISFAPGLLPTSIRYTNRPSGIQQVLSISGHRPRR
jgi:acyl-homoserine lactone acylase PvdQ